MSEERTFIGNWIKLNPDLQPHKVGYEDVLLSPNAGARGALKLAPVLPPLQANSASELRTRVLTSQRIQNAVELLTVSLKQPVSDIAAIAGSQYDSMAANLDPLAARSLFALVAPVINQLFSHIYVNVKALDKIRSAMLRHPVVLLPSHRSYLDFILLDIALYICDMPLPTIAAATDFSSMRVVGEWLRRCGAFFVQRGTGNAANLVTKSLYDPEDENNCVVRPLLVVDAEKSESRGDWKFIAADYLHRSILAEYIHQLVVYGHHRFLEFFIEGKRSRTGKACPPKRGLLNSIAEAYLHGDVDEIYLCPVSICYDRFLEEGLYARELLGTPKPKESTSGLLQSVSTILKNNYGSVVFTFGEPISLRAKATASGRITRRLHALHPAWIGAHTVGEREFLTELSLHIVDIHHQLTSLPVFSIVAACLLGNVLGQENDPSAGGTMSLSQLVERVSWLLSVLSASHRTASLSLSHSLDWTILEVLRIHSNILSLNRKDDTVSLQCDEDNGLVSLVQLTIYRNQGMFALFPMAALATCIATAPSEVMTLDELFERYAFLAHVLRIEFVSSENFESSKPPTGLRSVFDRTVSLMVDTQVLCKAEQGGFDVERSAKNPDTELLKSLLQPFIFGYSLSCSFLLLRTSVPSIFLRNAENIALLERIAASPSKTILSQVLDLVKRGSLPLCAAWSISTELVTNAVTLFGEMGLLAKSVQRSKPPTVNVQKMEEFREKLVSLLSVQYQSTVATLPQVVFLHSEQKNNASSSKSVHSKL